MKVNVYNIQGKVVRELDLNEAVFGVEAKPEVVHEVFIAQTGNQREPWAHTKDRGDVRGGGKKPWAQKGTGRARHGSIRSPIWKGGGVTFGPLNTRDYKKKINAKVRRLATIMCLSDKQKAQKLVVVDEFNFAEPKTKLFAAFLKALPMKSKSLLVLTANKNTATVRMVQNIPGADVLPASDVNVMELLNHQSVFTTVEGIKAIEQAFSK